MSIRNQGSFVFTLLVTGLFVATATSPVPAQDVSPPTVAITQPASGVWTGNSINVAATASDGVGLAQITLWGNGTVFGTIACAGGATCGGATWWITGPLAPGAYQVQAVATDTAGHQTVSAPIVIYKDATSPVVVSGASTTTAPPSGQALDIAWDHPANGASMCTTGLATGWVVVGGSGTRTGTLTIDGVKILDHDAGPGPDKKEGSYFWNAASAASGPHTFTVTINDQAGGADSSTITVNLQNPVPAITSPASGATVKGVVPVAMSTTDLCASHEFTLLVDGTSVGTIVTGATKTATIEWNTSGWPDGAHQLTAVVNGSGVTKTASVSVVVQNAATPGGSDTTKPAVSITSPASGVWTGNSINVAASAADNVKLASIKLWGNGAVFGTIPCSGATCSGQVWWVTGGLPPAAYEVQAVATDTSGNTKNSAKIIVYKDATSPLKASGAPGEASGGTTASTLAAHFGSPAANATVSGAIEIAMSADNVQGGPTQFVLKLDNATTLSSQSVGGASASYVWNSATVPNGTHTLNLTVTDGGGRTATAAVTIFVANGTTTSTGGDTTAPAVSITSPANGDWTGNSIDVTAVAKDAVGLATLTFFGNGAQFAQVSCGNATTCSSIEWWVTKSLSSGAHTITVVATDTAGNTKASAPVTIYK